MKIKKQKKKKTKTSISKNISSIELEQHVEISNIHNDVLSLIGKYAGAKVNTSAYGDKLNNKEGFFLMWIKKDTNLPANEQLQIYTFAKLINLDDVVKAMEKTVADMVEEQKAPKNLA